MDTNLEETTKTIDTNTSTIVTQTDTEPNEKVTSEEFKISGDLLVAKIKELIHQGNIRRIIIKHEEGNTLIEIPMTVGVIGGVISAAFFPVLAAIGVIGAMVAHLTIVIERQESTESSEDDKE
ncbi:DUF4342 domain-containing protein [Calothrix rhizosoleniae]|uniref:DUF4342 domain-containing protein n=1 Tax=Calothrix rhizosoleniae TaxID=888997 RepID=UPI000B498B38|nr:DUF4342 domain-containing protein [Calothrix rhizosoleniae]